MKEEKTEQSKPALLVEYERISTGEKHSLFVCLDCFNNGKPDDLKLTILPFNGDEPEVGESLCDPCNDFVHRI